MSLKKYLGGVYDTPEYQTVVTGGFNKTKYQKFNRVIGNKANGFFQSKLIEWKTFKEFKNTDFDKLISAINKIMPLVEPINDPVKLWVTIRGIYNLDDAKIINLLANMAGIYDPIKIALKHLFMMYKIYIENLIQLFVKTRNKYIDDNNLKYKKQDFDEMAAEWVMYDAENNLSSSSPILALGLTKINPIDWTIPDKKVLNKFLMKLKQFKYIGFCPHAIPERFAELAQFPTEQLSDMIRTMIKFNPTYNISEIQKIKKQIQNIKKIKHPPLAKRKHQTALSKSKKKRIEQFTTYIKSYVALYKETYPIINEHEQKICAIVKSITKVSNQIEKLSESLIML